MYAIDWGKHTSEPGNTLMAISHDGARLCSLYITHGRLNNFFFCRFAP